MFRELAERISRSRVIKRRLSVEFGRRTIYVSPDAALSLLKLDLQSANQDLFHAASHHVKRDDHVWDIGANVGLFAVVAAHTAGKNGSVVSVEADPFLATLLQRTSLHPSNHDLAMSTLCCAVSDQVGLAEFLISNRGRASNSLASSGHRSQAGGTRFTQQVLTLTLDRMLDFFTPPQFVKIDVEGAEVMVLEGARKLLSDIRPSLYVEVGAPQSEAATQILIENRYKLFDGDKRKPCPVDSCTYNTLAIPSERVDDYLSMQD